MKVKFLTIFFILCLFLFNTSLLFSADWLSYRGPFQNGTSNEKLNIPVKELNIHWSKNVGVGASSVVVKNNKLFTTGNINDKDIVYCFDLESGSELWKYEFKSLKDPRMFEGGTASTPLIDEDSLYVASHQGDIFSFNTETGNIIWKKNYCSDFNGIRPEWGFSGSPVIYKDLLIIDTGGTNFSTIALNKKTGNIIWKNGSYKAGYSTPVIYENTEKESSVIIFKESRIVNIQLTTGIEIWNEPWPAGGSGINAISPLLIDNKVFVSSYNKIGSSIFNIENNKIVKEWQNRNIKIHINSPIYCNGFIYGITNLANPRSPLVCIDKSNGNVKWSEMIGGGSIILVDNKIVALSEKGELIIIEPSHEKFKSLFRQQVLGYRSFVQPVISNGYIICKNNIGDLVVFKSP